MSSLVVLGASGFLGRNVLTFNNFELPIKAVSRRIPADIQNTKKKVSWFAADLLTVDSLNNIIDPGDIVINLVYMKNADEKRNVELIDNILAACINARVARLIHCSTAVVVGTAKTSFVDEITPCVPITAYEKTKLNIEKRIITFVNKGIDVGILRPTAIVGPGSNNLLKLAISLHSGNKILNYLRASLFRRRPMHLVPVHLVVAALFHLALFPKTLDGNIFIVSADDDANNNFESVEAYLMRNFGQKSRMVPLFPLTMNLISLLLKLRGDSDSDMNRYYSAQKLRSTNFISHYTIEDSIRQFYESYINIQTK